VAGILLDAIFLDLIDYDALVLERLNLSFAKISSCPSPKPRSSRLGASEICSQVQDSEAHRRSWGRAGILRPSALHGQAGFALHEG